MMTFDFSCMLVKNLFDILCIHKCLAPLDKSDDDDPHIYDEKVVANI